MVLTNWTDPVLQHLYITEFNGNEIWKGLPHCMKTQNIHSTNDSEIKPTLIGIPRRDNAIGLASW